MPHKIDITKVPYSSWAIDLQKEKDHPRFKEFIENYELYYYYINEFRFIGFNVNVGFIHQDNRIQKHCKILSIDDIVKWSNPYYRFKQNLSITVFGIIIIVFIFIILCFLLSISCS